MNVDLIIPAFNEAENINALFDQLDQLPPGMVRRIILTDNNSTDETAQLAAARGAIVLHEPRRGYGLSCLKALNWIRAHDSGLPEVIVFLDADLSDDPLELPRVLAPLDPAVAGRTETILKGSSSPEKSPPQMVIGSRVRKAQPGALNPAQRFGNRLACGMIRFFTGTRFSDLGPFRAITWPALEVLRMQDETWGWTVEMQMKAALLNMPFAEVDVDYRKRHAGKSKISGTLRGIFTAGIKIIATILSLWWNRKSIRATAVPWPSRP